MTHIKLKHLVAVRWFHWINFPLLLLMIWSGLLIYWANDIYHIGRFHFFPNWFYSLLHVDHRLAEGMALHFVFMWLFVINGIAYIGYTFYSGEWRLLVPTSWKAFPNAFHVMLYDLGLRKTLPPQEKYNAAQQLSYTGIIVMGMGSVVSGFAIYKPVQLSWLTALFFGYEGARMVHFLLTIGYVLFFLVHITQVIRAGWSNFQSMITGCEIVKNVAEQHAPVESPHG
mgnify:CR=1 FL=1